MRKLYPDLAGVNPLVRSRQIDTDDIQRFQQFGLGLFVNVDTDLHTQINLKPNIKTLLDVFIRRIAARTVVLNDKNINSLMDWPYLKANLRSEEQLMYSQNAQDLRAKIPNFWITMKQLLMSEMLAHTKRSEYSQQSTSNHTTSNTEEIRDDNPSGQKHSVYSGLYNTTLDPGGHCHRQPIVKMTSNQLHSILASDVCFVTSGNDTFRHLRCTSRGVINETVFTLPTTSQHGIVDRDAFFEAKKLYKACGPIHSNHSKTRNTSIFAWNSERRSFEPQTTRDETSLSKRVRISPIWNMLTRLKGTSVYESIDPHHAWGQTDTRRHDNPRWASNSKDANTIDAMWQSNWVYSNTDDECKNKNFGTISQANWYNNPNKAKTCLRISREFRNEQPGCMRKLGNTFDICQINELKDFCYAIQNIRTEVRQINAVANQYTNRHKNLYMPSRYLKQDGMFGWSAIVETYNTIDPTLTADKTACPGIDVLLSNSDKSRTGNTQCLAGWVFEISIFLEKIRNIVGDIVSIIVLAQQIAIDMVLFLFAALAGDKNMQADKIQVILTGLKELLVKIIEYYRQMLGILWEMLTSDGGTFQNIEEFLEEVCIFVQNLANTVLEMTQQIIKALKYISPFSFG